MKSKLSQGTLQQRAARATRMADRLTLAADDVLCGESGLCDENEDGNMPRDQIEVALGAHREAAELHRQAGNAKEAKSHASFVRELEKALKKWDRDYRAAVGRK